MKKFPFDDKDYWSGIHETLGIIIYDPTAQEKVDPEKVRLWISSQSRMGTFKKDILEDRLISDNHKSNYNDPTYHDAVQEYDHQVQPYVKKYHDLRIKMMQDRFTHCFRCKQDINSRDFRLCEKCEWIKCDCMACGCEYERM